MWFKVKKQNLWQPTSSMFYTILTSVSGSVACTTLVTKAPLATLKLMSALYGSFWKVGGNKFLMTDMLTEAWLAAVLPPPSVADTRNWKKIERKLHHILTGKLFICSPLMMPSTGLTLTHITCGLYFGSLSKGEP